MAHDQRISVIRGRIEDCRGRMIHLRERMRRTNDSFLRNSLTEALREINIVISQLEMTGDEVGERGPQCVEPTTIPLMEFCPCGAVPGAAHYVGCKFAKRS